MAQVTLQAVVNFEQVNQLQQRIDKLNGSKITIGVQDFTRQMKEAGTATGKVSESLSKVVRVFDANGGLVSGVEKYQKGIGTTVELMQKFNKETEQLEQTGSRVIRDLAKEQKAAAKAAEEHAKYVAECNREYEKYQQYLASQQKNTPIQNRIDALTGVYRDDPVTRKEFTDFGRLLIKQEEQAAKAAEKAAAAQKKEEEATADANKEVKKQGLLYDVLGRSVSSFLARMVAYRAVYAGIRAITNGFREALETLKAVDDELVTVRKVTGFAPYQMARVEEQAYAVASKYGTSASDYTSSVAAFARAGYKDLSGDLAELAEKTKIVGDTTAEVAQQFLLSVDAAYKYKGNIQALTAVLDGANEIDNKYATSIEKIAEGMGIVAPVAAQMNVSVDELAASIGTITAVTQRTGTEAARALRAIYLNIVGDTKTEIEEGVTWTTGEIEGLRDVVKLYAKDAWDAAQASGGIIDPMEAIAGLAKSVKDGVLTEAKLMEMVSDIGGKLRTSQLLALINNWDMYESMLNDYRNAYGSAEKEIENAMDSWTRKSEVLKNTWTQFVKTGLNSDAFKGFLDLLTSIVQRLGSLPGTLTRIATIVVGLNFNHIAKSLSNIVDSTGKLKFNLNSVSTIITGIGIAWSVVSYIVEDAKRKHEKAVEKIYEQADAAKESAENILTLYADFNSATEGSDALTESVKKLAEALGEDIPEGADAASKALAGFTLQSIQTTIEALNTAKVTAESELLDVLKNSFPGTLGVRVGQQNELPQDLTDIIEGITGSLPGNEMLIGFFTIDQALQVRDAFKLVSEAFDEYIYKTGEAWLLDTQYYTELQSYLGATEEAYSKYLDAVNSLDEANLKKKFLELTSTIRVDSVDAYQDLIQRIGLYRSYTDDEREALIALAELYYPQYAKAIKDAEAATDDLTEAVEEENNSLFKNQEALEADATATERAAAAKKDAEAAVSQFCDALFDETGELTAAGKAALAASQYLADLVQAELNARVETAKANYANLRAQLAAVATDALKAAYALIALEDAAAESGIVENDAARLRRMAGGADSLLRQLRELEGIINSTEVQATYVAPYTSGYSTSSSGHSGGGSSSSSSSTEDKKLTSLRDRVTLLKSELSLMQARGDSEEDQIAKMREIQAALEAERAYLASIKGDQATINGLAEEWWNYQNKITDLQEQAADAAQKQADAVQAALEATIALANAEKQRSVRVYNAATGQWEWQADPSKVASARESYNSAVGNLTDEERAVYESALDAWKRSMLKQTLATYWLGGSLPDFIQRDAITSNLSNLFNSVKNGSTYNMGGVTISEAQAKSMSVYDFAQLSGSLAAYNHSV